MTDEVRQEAWECFLDAGYYDLWCVRRVGEREFGQGFHLVNGKEAEALCAFLTTETSPLRTRIAELEGFIQTVSGRNCDCLPDSRCISCRAGDLLATLNGEKKHG